LNLNTTLISTEESNAVVETDTSNSQRKLLWTVLIINFLFFRIGNAVWYFFQSMGLVADSLDMLADSIVYALALFAVGWNDMQEKATSPNLQVTFKSFWRLSVLLKLCRRFFGFEKMPDFQTMIIVSVLALIANVFCLYLLQKNKSKEAHMQASMIFTSNDVIINSGVIIAGLLVNWLSSSYPDLIIGAIVFVIVARGAYRILKLAK
jgi:Co/Zn/Cd efflux system component